MVTPLTTEEPEELPELTPRIHTVNIASDPVKGWVLNPPSACELTIRSRDIVRFIIDRGQKTAVLTFLDTGESNEPFGLNPIVIHGQIELGSMLPPLAKKEQRKYAYSIYVRQQEGRDGRRELGGLVDCTEPIMIIDDMI